MARQTPPELLGVLNSHEDAPSDWIRTVWRLPSGGVRIVAQKSFLGAKTAQQHAEDGRMPLVDAEGNIVTLDKA